MDQIIDIDNVNIGHYALYPVFHACKCSQLYSHSQSDCDTHKTHDCETYPIEFYKRYVQIKHNSNVLNRPINPNVLRDLIAEYCFRKGIYKTYKQAQNKANPFVAYLMLHNYI